MLGISFERLIVQEHNTYEQNTQESHSRRSINILWLQRANESVLIKEPHSRREADRLTGGETHHIQDCSPAPEGYYMVFFSDLIKEAALR